MKLNQQIRRNHMSQRIKVRTDHIGFVLRVDKAINATAFDTLEGLRRTSLETR